MQSESERLICLPSPHLRVQSLKKNYLRGFFFFHSEERKTEKVCAGDHSDTTGVEVICFIYLCQTITHKRGEVK